MPDNNLDAKNDYRQLISKYTSNWPWILVSMLMCLIAAFLYLRYTTPVFKISARVLVNDEKKGGGLNASSAAGLTDLSGLLGGKSIVDNEVEVLKTKYLMQQVVKDLNLNIIYYNTGLIRGTETYAPPFIVQPAKYDHFIEAVNVQVNLLDNNKLALTSDGLDTVISFDQSFRLPDVGTFKMIKNPVHSAEEKSFSFDIVPADVVVNSLLADLNVAVSNKLVTIIDLSINNVIPDKGVDILNRLIFNYVASNLQDKNEVADSTIAFIKRRLLIIGDELGGAEGQIEEFKQKNSLADMTEQGKLLVASTGQYVNELAKVETQISITKNLVSYLNDNSTNKRVLPSTLTGPDLVFSGAIEKYNTLLLERGRKLIGLTEGNPIIVNLDREIANARADIEENLNSTLNGLLITRARLTKQLEASEGRISEVPSTERNYLRLARQQQIKQELFLFLMQKSEETAISKTANIANSKTIDPPKAEIKPFAPKKSNVYMVALMMGLFFPLGFIYVKDFFNNKIERKEDITDKVKVPVLGEISHNNNVNNLAISESSRSAIAEQFRALRTNLSFYLKADTCNTILVTSSMPGEGKSFVSLNLGHVLAISGKKVLLVELDLRKPALSSKLGTVNPIGFTNYILSDTLSPVDLIFPLAIHQNISLVSSGPIPPNPAETLMNTKTATFFSVMAAQFDYIIIDAPPIGLVTDAQLLSKFSNLCLYIVRQNYTPKDQLKIIQDLYELDKMDRLGIVLNDVLAKAGYGYGYYHEEEPKKNKWTFWKHA
jgi:tyrosine-protein kinase Etk/Wzc